MDWIPELIDYIGLISVPIVSILLRYYLVERKKAADATEREKVANHNAAVARENLLLLEQEIEFRNLMLNMMVSLPSWAHVCDRHDKVVKNTRAKRIIQFCAFNGRKTPTETNAVFQWREDYTRVRAYLGVDLTDPKDNGHYVSLLNQMEKNGSIRVVTDLLPDCMIRTIHMDQGIKESEWITGFSVYCPETGQRALVYYSAAALTPDELSITDLEMVKDCIRETVKVLKNGLAQMNIADRGWIFD